MTNTRSYARAFGGSTTITPLSCVSSVGRKPNGPSARLPV
jgi:hypothetical protein